MSLLDKIVAKSVPSFPKAIVKRMSNRYIAGETIADTVRCIEKLNKEGFCATVDFLGEVIADLSDAANTANEYMQVIEAINHHRLDANISVKPTAMGLLIDEEACFHTLRCLVEAAAKHGIFVRIDMEDVRCTQKEIDLLLRLRKDHDNVGIVLQAYLKRTYDDIENLIERGVNLRLCKGIYVEDPLHLVDKARTDRKAINPHFFNHIRRTFDAGTYVGIATHDENLVHQVEELIKRSGPNSGNYEFQMLLGVCEKLRNRIKANGHKVRIYVPYGKDWYGYSMRRLNENPKIAGYIFKAALFGI